MNTPHLLTTKIFFPWQLGLQLKSFCINESQTIRGLFCVRKTHMLCHVSWQPSALWLQLPQCQAQHDTVHARVSACVRARLCVRVCVWEAEKESEWVSPRAPLPAWFNICQPLSVWSALSCSQDQATFLCIRQKDHVCFSFQRVCVYLDLCVVLKHPLWN